MGSFVGLSVTGFGVGSFVVLSVTGFSVGFSIGIELGCFMGLSETGLSVGCLEGEDDGDEVGEAMITAGDLDGAAVGGSEADVVALNDKHSSTRFGKNDTFFSQHSSAVLYRSLFQDGALPF